MILPYVENNLIIDRYKIKNYLDKGGMQYVFLAEDLLLNRNVVLKTPQELSTKKRFHDSAILSAKINHPNVAKTLDYFETSDGRAHLIEEYIDGENLQQGILDKVYYMDPFLVAKLFHYLAKSLKASHHANVVHRDLKPTNIMIKGTFDLTEIKITDFGIAKLVEEEIKSENQKMLTQQVTNSGTVMSAIPYMAPEVIHDPSSSTFPADIWSLGAIIYHCLTGMLPFGEKALVSIGRILSADYIPAPKFVTENKQFESLSLEILGIIEECLSLDPVSRPTAEELILKCGDLCYQINSRHTGYVGHYPLSPNGYTQKSYGFIYSDQTNGQDAFYHQDNVYGKTPELNEKILYSKYPSKGQWRALPIIRLKSF